MLDIDVLFEKKYGYPQKLYDLIYELANLSADLKLSNEQKNDIILETVNLIGYSCFSEKDAVWRSLKEDLDLYEVLDNEFQKDLNNLISKYRSQFSTEFSTDIFHLIQLGFKDKIDSIKKAIPIKLTDEIRIELVKYLSKSRKGRPRSENYDMFIHSIYEVLMRENEAYMPQLLRILNTVKTHAPEVLENYEINENSIRTKLSKIRKSPLNKKRFRIWEFNKGPQTNSTTLT